MHLEIPVLIDLLIHSITKLQPPLNLYFQSFMLLYKNYPFESQHYNCTISIYKYHWSYSAKIVIFIKINMYPTVKIFLISNSKNFTLTLNH